MIIDGKKIGQEITDRLKSLNEQEGIAPLLCDVVVGDNPVSHQYVQLKKQKAEMTGFMFKEIALPLESTTEEVVKAVREAHELPSVAGIIVQLPLPEHIDREQVTEAIDPKFDVDCLTKQNAQAFYENKNSFAFPTALACMKLLESTGVEMKGKNVVIVGEGELVGSPVKALLARRNIFATSINNSTENKAEIIKNADVLISATGAAKSITGDMIQEGVIVIDAGTAESNSGLADGRASIVGDVDFESVKDKVSFIAKVPGGVGPVTVSMLLSNVFESYKKNHV